MTETSRATRPPPPPAPGPPRADATMPGRPGVGQRRQARGVTPVAAARALPVARVALEVPLPHLDRPFDYAVPARFDAAAVPGVRVRVRFAGQQVSGFLLERVAASEHPGPLAWLGRVVSPQPVLTPEVLRLARGVADHYAGTLADVLRLAIPPRHARVEREVAPAHPADAADSTPAFDLAAAERVWGAFTAGPAFVRALAAGRSPRAVWSALPASGDWPAALAAGVAAALASGRGVLVVVPDGRDVQRVDAALTHALGPGRHACLTAELGPAERYRRWLRVLRGEVRAVVGTRAAAFAPVADLGLAVVWDDGDDLHAEPRAPYPHTREVLALRAHQSGAGLLLGGLARTPEAAQLVATGWARPIDPARGAVRVAAPRVLVAGDDAELARDEAAHAARLPSAAWRTARAALERGPVLVQVPRRGYVPALACERCRAAARCSACAGPLAVAGQRAGASCRWCGASAAAPATRWSCPACGGARLRAVAVGARRTAEELGRAFPAVPVRTSGGLEVLATVSCAPGLVVATPGAEPVAEGGYAAALLLDGWALLGRPDLRAAEEALRRWLTAAALVRPAAAGGAVVLVADAAARPVQALVRWDPAGFAERELADRIALGFPPASRVAVVDGAPEDVQAVLGAASLPAGAQVLGPLTVHPAPTAAAAPAEPRARAVVRVPRQEGLALAAALRAAQATRVAQRAGRPVRVRIDPLDLG